MHQPVSKSGRQTAVPRTAGLLLTYQANDPLLFALRNNVVIPFQRDSMLRPDIILVIHHPPPARIFCSSHRFNPIGNQIKQRIRMRNRRNDRHRRRRQAIPRSRDGRLGQHQQCRGID